MLDDHEPQKYTLSIAKLLASVYVVAAKHNNRLYNVLIICVVFLEKWEGRNQLVFCHQERSICDSRIENV